MARLSIQMPVGLHDGAGPAETEAGTATDGGTARREGRETDAATERLLAWLACWAGR
jgi:hypothetical protein